jgi:hypothetical protein
VLKDIWGASDREVEGLARWMLDAIVTAALRDARPATAQRRGAEIACEPAKSTRPRKRGPGSKTSASKRA